MKNSYFLILLLLIYSGNLSADSEDTRGDFFEPNFAVSGGLAPEIKVDPPILGEEQTEPQPETSISRQVAPKSSEALRSVTLIAATNDKEHVDQISNEIQILLQNKKIPFKNALLIGDNDSSKDLKSLLERSGISTVSINSLPYAVEISNSPSWILAFSKNAVLLDGFLNIEQFVDRNGYFLPPGNVPQISNDSNVHKEDFNAPSF